MYIKVIQLYVCICIFQILLWSIILFVYFWLCWVFVAVHGLSLVVESGGCSSLGYAGCFCCGAGVLGAWASVVVALGL